MLKYYSMELAATAFILFIIFVILIQIIIFGFLVFLLVLWVIMLIDVIRRKNWQSEDQKLLWLLVVILTGGIGALIYYYEIYKKLGKAI